MTNTASLCPRSLYVLLGLLLQKEFRRELVDDLDELHWGMQHEISAGSLKRRYWLRALESLPSLMMFQMTWGLNMLMSYFRLAVRNLRKQKLHSLITTLSFAVGLACSILILMFVYYEMNFDRFQENGDNIYRLLYTADAGDETVAQLTCGAIALEIADDLPEIENACRIWPHMRQLVAVEGQSFDEKNICFTDQSFLEMFTFPVQAGDKKSMLTAPRQAVLTKSAKEKYFGTGDAIGKTLHVDGRFNYQVVGVVADPPQQSHISFDLLLSARGLNDHMPFGLEDWGCNSCITYVKLASGADPGSLEGKLPSFFEKHDDDSHFFLQPLYDIHLHSTHISGHTGDIKKVRLLAGIGLLILLIAAFNYVNLAMARGPLRSVEISMRKVMGASRKNLMLLFMGESILVTSLAAIISLFLVSFLLPSFNTMVMRSMAMKAFFTWEVAAMLTALVLLLGVVAGFYPAFYLSRFSPQAVLMKRRSAGRMRMFSLRQMAIMLQFGISLVLIICSVVMNSQMRYIRNRNLGFNSQAIVTVKIKSQQLKKNAYALKTELMSLAAVEDVCVSSALPTDHDWSRGGGRPDWVGPGAPESITFYQSFVGNNFLDFYGMTLVAGRDFAEGNPADEEAVIVNETAARQFDWEEPLGRVADGRTVIGVVKDYHFRSLSHKVEPMLISLAPRDESRYIAIKLGNGPLRASLEQVKPVWDAHAGGYPFDYRFLDKSVEAWYRQEKRMNAIVLAFALLAVSISCFGILGLSQFRVEQRSKEVGIRRTLGASRVQIFTALSADFLKWVGIANLIAWPAAYFIMNRWLLNYAYRINLDLNHFLVASLMTLTIALLVISAQSIKAAMTNPIESLRYE